MYADLLLAKFGARNASKSAALRQPAERLGRPRPTAYELRSGLNLLLRQHDAKRDFI